MSDPITKGIDVSKYQGQINWQAVADSGIAFAYIRLMDNNGLDIDPMFAVNWKEAKEAGIARGFYVISYPWINVGEAVTNAERYLREYASGDWWCGELRPALDVEPNTQYAPQNYMAQNVRRHLELLTEVAKVRPMIYTSQVCWDGFIDSIGTQREWAWKYELWIAHYLFVRTHETNWDHFDPSFRPLIPNAWNNFIIHQWAGDDGRCVGVPSACDLNYWRGDLAGFTAYLDIINYERTGKRTPAP